MLQPYFKISATISGQIKLFSSNFVIMHISYGTGI